jgi:RNase P/RNase MRP subunit POP5
MRRPSRRYLAFRVISDAPPSFEKLSDQIDRSMRRLFGEIGAPQAHARLARYNSADMIGVLRCSAAWLENVRAALALTTNIEGSRCALLIMKSSGTLASLNRTIDPLHSRTRRKE